jgi:hypothetical protein
MSRVVRELRSIPGLVLGTTLALIVTLWVLNLLATKTPAPISTGAGWAFGRATGQAYSAPAAPVVVSSPYSTGGNGPLI